MNKTFTISELSDLKKQYEEYPDIPFIVEDKNDLSKDKIKYLVVKDNTINKFRYVNLITGKILSLNYESIEDMFSTDNILIKNSELIIKGNF